MPEMLHTIEVHKSDSRAHACGPLCCPDPCLAGAELQRSLVATLNRHNPDLDTPLHRLALFLHPVYREAVADSCRIEDLLSEVGLTVSPHEHLLSRC